MSPFPAEPLNTASSGSVSGKWPTPVQPTPEPDTGGEVCAEHGPDCFEGCMTPRPRPEPDSILRCFTDAQLADRLAEAVKAERERIAAAIEKWMEDRPAMSDDRRYGMEEAASLARTAPLQDAEEVGE